MPNTAEGCETMNIRIFQINLARDRDRLAFMDFDWLHRHLGFTEINRAIYDLVFEGEVNCSSLEDVFRMFNLDHPEGYRGRSLSVSDIVEVLDSHRNPDSDPEFTKPEFSDVKAGCYFCDSIGFRRLSFDHMKG